MRSRMALGDFLVAYLRRAGVTHIFGLPGDLVLGLFDRFTPRFVKKYAEIHHLMLQAFSDYKLEVESYQFPAEEHSTGMKPEEWEAFLEEIAPQNNTHTQFSPRN